MTGLGKWLVVLHTGMSLMAATMGIALFATEPDYNGRLKEKAEQVATQRKSLDLNGAAKREAEAVRAQDFKNFEEDRKNFSEFCREDMAKCELKVRRRLSVLRFEGAYDVTEDADKDSMNDFRKLK